MSVRDGWTFVREFATRPRQVGALLPSSSGLATRMVEWIDWPQARAVVEFGPGTGAFTGHIVAAAPEATRLLAVEINPRLAELLRVRYPRVTVYQDSVAHVRQLCDEAGIDQVDAILCGLPWANFSEQEQQAFLAATIAVLRPGGQFATFAYLQGLLLPSARRFRRTLQRWFQHVDRSPVVWGNFPPALVYRCRR